MKLEEDVKQNITKKKNNNNKTTNTGLVYCALNTVNGRRYIGLTSRSLEERKREHYRDANYKDKEFYEELLNKDNRFEWYILEDNIKVKDLFQREYYYINKYKDKLYNLNKGSMSSYRLNPVGDLDTKSKYGINDLTEEVEELFIELHNKGYSFRAISRETLFSRHSVTKVIKEYQNRKGIDTKSVGYKNTYEDALRVYEQIKEGSRNLKNIGYYLNLSKDFVNGVFNGRYTDLVSDKEREEFKSKIKYNNTEESNRKSVTKDRAYEIVKIMIEEFGYKTAKEMADILGIKERLIYEISLRNSWEDIWVKLEKEEDFDYENWRITLEERRKTQIKSRNKTKNKQDDN